LKLELKKYIATPSKHRRIISQWA